MEKSHTTFSKFSNGIRFGALTKSVPTPRRVLGEQEQVNEGEQVQRKTSPGLKIRHWGAKYSTVVRVSTVPFSLEGALPRQAGGVRVRHSELNGAENNERLSGLPACGMGHVVPLHFALIVPTPASSAHYVPCPSAHTSTSAEGRTEETRGIERNKDKPLATRQKGIPRKVGNTVS